MLIIIYTEASTKGFLLLHIPRQIPIGRLSKRQAIAHKLEPILGSILVLKVLCSKLFQHFSVVNHAAGVHSCHSAIDLAIFEPGSAVPYEYCLFHRLLDVGIEILQRILPNLDGPG